MPEFSGTERVSASMQVVNVIRDAVRKGTLSVGERLPNESDLARQLGVGRSSVREGMRILNAYGVVEIRQGEGTYVVNRCAEQMFEFIGFIPDNSNIQPLIELRRILETGSIKLVTRKIEPDGIAKMEMWLNAMRSDELASHNIKQDKAFHEYLIASTNNPLLIQIYSMLSKMMANLMSQLMCHEDVLQDAISSHTKILEALRNADVESAIRAMDEHLDKILMYAAIYIPKLGKTPG